MKTLRPTFTFCASAILAIVLHAACAAEFAPVPPRADTIPKTFTEHGHSRTETDNNALLLKTEMEAGHGGASGRYKQYREYAFMYAFLLGLADIHE